MSKKKILVVDDEQSITKLLKFALEKSGHYDVICENSSGNAVNTALASRPDLIILDINMPDVSGGEIAASLKEDSALSGIPVIFLTGNVSADESESGLMISGHPTLAKPINMENLLKRVQQSLP